MLAYDWNFLGLSTETKPAAGEKVVDGSTFYECDTSTFFIFYQGEWYQQTFVTEDGINFWLYKTLMKKMFGKLFDSNISKGKIIRPTTGTEIEFTTTQIAQITDLTGYGDTFQQTYSGKNLLDIPDGYTGISSGVTTTWSNNIATSNASSTTSTTCTLTSTLSFKSTALPAGTYTFSVQSSTSQYHPILRLRDTSNTWHNYPITAGENSVTITTDYSADRAQISLGLWTAGTAITNFVTEYPMLEVGSSVTSYEPYTGGIASPNPDYPQDIDVVTGEQTVTITDGGSQSQSYTVNLGSIELCKIGDYQDYIYRDADGDWYVHKEIARIVLTGDVEEAWSLSSTGNFFVTSAYPDVIMVSRTTIGPIISTYYSAATRADLVNATIDYGIGVNYDTPRIYIRNKDIANANDFGTWLSTHNTAVYYAISTPTDTKITDNILISNLNSLLNYIFPVGDHQLVITADDLPMALKLTITEKE